MSEARVQQIRQIGEATWVRHFDDQLGLGYEELIRYPCCEPAQPMPAIERLLADLPQHLIALRLIAEQLLVPARTMVIADIFEAP